MYYLFHFRPINGEKSAESKKEVAQEKVQSVGRKNDRRKDGFFQVVSIITSII
jgi:hypothetical protein